MRFLQNNLITNDNFILISEVKLTLMMSSVIFQLVAKVHFLTIKSNSRMLLMLLLNKYFTAPKN